MRETITRRIKTREEIEDLQKQRASGEISYMSPGFNHGMHKFCGEIHTFHTSGHNASYYIAENGNRAGGYTWAECWLEEPYSEIELAKIEWDKQQEGKK